MFAETLTKNFLKRMIDGEIEFSPEVIEQFGEECKAALVKQSQNRGGFRIRMSGLGRPLCQQLMARDGKDEEMSYNAVMRFLIGDLVEAAVMAVLRSAGVDVVDTQTPCELSLGGEKVKGTLDLIMDDPVDGKKVWDIKSASPFSYSQKFGKGYHGMKQDDPFGYLVQGHLYAEAQGMDFGGWIVVDKSSGEIQFVEAPDDQQEDRQTYLEQAEDAVIKVKEGFQYKKPPMEPQIETHKVKGETVPTGNKLLNKSCTFCGYRKHCWPKAVEHPKVTSKARMKPTAWYHTLKVKEL